MPRVCSVLRDQKRGTDPVELALQAVVNRHVGAWRRIWVFFEISHCFLLLSHLSSPPPCVLSKGLSLELAILLDGLDTNTPPPGISCFSYLGTEISDATVPHSAVTSRGQWESELVLIPAEQEALYPESQFLSPLTIFFSSHLVRLCSALLGLPLYIKSGESLLYLSGATNLRAR